MKSSITVVLVLLSALLALSFCVALAENEKTNATLPSNLTNATNMSSNATNETKLATNPFACAKEAIPIGLPDETKAKSANETNSTNETTKIVVVKR